MPKNRAKSAFYGIYTKCTKLGYFQKKFRKK